MPNSTHQDIARYFACIISPFSSFQAIQETIEKIHYMNDGAELLVNFANRHFMVPTLHYALQEHQLLSSFDETFQAYLETLSHFQAERNLAIKQQCTEFIEQCNQESVNPILLKGVSTLFNDVYPEVYMRHMSDMDILFSPNEIEKARQLLVSLGYTIPGQYRETKPSHHFPPYYRVGDACPIELHIQPVSLFYSCYLSVGMAFTNYQTLIDNENTQYQSLSPTHEILHCFIHSQLSDKHFIFKRINFRHMDYFVRMIKLYDKQIDWDYIQQSIQHPKDKLALQHYLYMINKLFNTKIPIENDLLTRKELEQYSEYCLSRSVSKRTPFQNFQLVTQDFFQTFTHRHLGVSYDAPQSRSMIWKRRAGHLAYFLKKYKNPKKLVERIKVSLVC